MVPGTLLYARARQRGARSRSLVITGRAGGGPRTEAALLKQILEEQRPLSGSRRRRYRFRRWRFAGRIDAAQTRASRTVLGRAATGSASAPSTSVCSKVLMSRRLHRRGAAKA